MLRVKYSRSRISANTSERALISSASLPSTWAHHIQPVLALGTEDIIEAIGRHSFVGYEGRRIRGLGRPHKVDRQEMMGCVAAVQRWFKLDHESRLAAAEQESLEIIKPLRGIPGVTAELIDNIIAHQPFGVTVSVDEDVVGFNNGRPGGQVEGHGSASMDSDD